MLIETGEVLVLKQIEISDPTTLHDYLNEVSLMKRLSHNHIVKYADYYQEGQRFCILSEFCEKGDLQQFISNQKGFPIVESKVKKFIIEILLALDFIHSNQVIHRDLKPSNIFLKGRDYQTKIGDFGISKSITGASVSNSNVGTMYYMSPEVIQNMEYTFKTDIWSLGCIIYQLCAQKVPFDASSEPKLVRSIVFNDAPALPQNYSYELSKIYKACLNKDPSQRPSASNLLSTLIIQKWSQELGIYNSQLQQYINYQYLLTSFKGFLGNKDSPIKENSKIDIAIQNQQPKTQRMKQVSRNRDISSSNCTNKQKEFIIKTQVRSTPKCDEIQLPNQKQQTNRNTSIISECSHQSKSKLPSPFQSQSQFTRNGYCRSVLIQETPQQRMVFNERRSQLQAGQEQSEQVKERNKSQLGNNDETNKTISTSMLEENYKQLMQGHSSKSQEKFKTRRRLLKKHPLLLYCPSRQKQDMKVNILNIINYQERFLKSNCVDVASPTASQSSKKLLNSKSNCLNQIQSQHQRN